MNSRRAAAIVMLAALVPFAAAPARAQNAPITNPPNVITPPAALPDLAIAKATFTLTCAPDKKTLIASYSATVVNNGKANASLANIPFNQIALAKWSTTIGNNNLEKPPVPPPAPPTASGPAVMKPGQTANVSMNIKNIPHYKKGTPSHAQYNLWVMADPTQGVPESNEQNNIANQFFKDPCPK
jgi:hypothetical protein